MSEGPNGSQDSLPSARATAASVYVFICCFLAGPAFGFLTIYLAYSLSSRTPVPFGVIAPGYPFALIFGGVQGYRAGLRLTDFLNANGYISFRYLVKTTGRVAFIPSALVAVLYFIGAWASHDLSGLFLWPIRSFAGAIALHAFAALGVGAMIFPLMRKPKQSLPAQ